MELHFLHILIFIIASIALLTGILFLGKIIRPARPNPEKLSTYESGEEPEGNANIQFNSRYYLLALVFVLFEVELLFLFPLVTVATNASLIEVSERLWLKISYTEIIIFIALLGLGLAYAWVKGLLEWEKPKELTHKKYSNIPADAYSKYL
jgi:NADH-quinone oxidoreductase subunit A